MAWKSFPYFLTPGEHEKWIVYKDKKKTRNVINPSQANAHTREAAGLCAYFIQLSHEKKTTVG